MLWQLVSRYSHFCLIHCCAIYILLLCCWFRVYGNWFWSLTVDLMQTWWWLDGVTQSLEYFLCASPYGGLEWICSLVSLKAQEVTDAVELVHVALDSWRTAFFRQTLNTTTTKDKLLHLLYQFSLFFTISLLFKCRFVAWRRGFPWKFAPCCLCHNK